MIYSFKLNFYFNNNKVIILVLSIIALIVLSVFIYRRSVILNKKIKYEVDVVRQKDIEIE